MPGPAVGSRGKCFVVASGGLVKVVAADGDGPAPFEVGLDLMSGDTAGPVEVSTGERRGYNSFYRGLLVLWRACLSKTLRQRV